MSVALEKGIKPPSGATETLGLSLLTKFRHYETEMFVPMRVVEDWLSFVQTELNSNAMATVRYKSIFTFRYQHSVNCWSAPSYGEDTLVLL